MAVAQQLRQLREVQRLRRLPVSCTSSKVQLDSAGLGSVAGSPLINSQQRIRLRTLSLSRLFRFREGPATRCSTTSSISTLPRML